MRFRVWREGIIREEGDVLIKITDYDEGCVEIEVVNEKGEWEWVLAELKEGELSRIGSIGVDEYSKDINIDTKGKIMLTE